MPIPFNEALQNQVCDTSCCASMVVLSADRRIWSTLPLRYYHGLVQRYWG